MRRELMPFWAALWVVLLVSSSGFAAATSSAGSHITDLTSSGGTFNVLDYYSDAYAFAASDLGGSDETENDGSLVNRLASGSVVGATATGQTGLHTLDATASVAPLDGAAGAYASAMQAMRFEVTGAGTLTFDAPYTMDQTLFTQLLGDTAGADTSVFLKLVRNGTVIEQESVLLSNSLADGASHAPWSAFGTLDVDGQFDIGDIGVVIIGVDAQTLAYTVPAPGALLLAGIGTVLMGRRRRRVLSSRC